MKYPRTFHLPWSPGGTKDDKKLKSVESFLGKEIVITEKLDGSNTCVNSQGVFARSHAQLASHPSFNYLKGEWNNFRFQLEKEEDIFGENCYAVHSISYTELPTYFFMFNVRKNGMWLSFSEVNKRAKELGLQLAPVLFEGVVSTEKELQKITEKLQKEPSVYGGDREGTVLRLKESFSEENFSKSVAKMVRKGHVQTDDHWMHQSIVKQNLKK